MLTPGLSLATDEAMRRFLGTGNLREGALDEAEAETVHSFSHSSG